MTMVIDEVKKIVSEVVGTDSAEKAKKMSATVQLVVFALAGEEYAVKIEDIQEIIETQKVTPIPSSPEFIKGILNLRGKIVVVIDLETRFSLTKEEKKEQKHIIIIQKEGNSYGILVDYVTEVIRVATDSIQPTPELITSKIEADFFDGVVILQKGETHQSDEEAKENRLIIILKMAKLLDEKALMVFNETIQKATGEEKS